jgi:hypothetical protein
VYVYTVRYCTAAAIPAQAVGSRLRNPRNLLTSIKRLFSNKNNHFVLLQTQKQHKQLESCSNYKLGEQPVSPVFIHFMMTAVVKEKSAFITTKILKPKGTFSL